MKNIIYLIILSLAINVNSIAQNSTIQNNAVANDFNNFSRLENSGSYVKGGIPVFNTKEATVGTRYLFDSWVSGSVTTMNDTVFANPNFLFNYDKVSKNLLATQDKANVIEIYLSQIKSFVLKDKDKIMDFERVDIINHTDFFQALVKDASKFSLYKSLQTKFIKSNYTTNGIAESGNKYDEYKDEISYYVVLPGGKDFRKLELKKKSIKQALSSETSKVEAYFSSHQQDILNEDFLTGLITNLDQ